MATYRDFFGIYVAILLAALIGPFILQTGNEIINAITVMTIFGLVFSMTVITFLAIIRLFNRRLFSNEGYLTLTLPVKTHITIIAKVITGLLWSFVTTLVFIVAALIFFGIYVLLNNLFNIADLAFLIDIFGEVIEALLQWEVIKALLIQSPMMLASGIKDLVLLVFVMTVINTSFIKKGKLPIGVAAYMILGSIISGISSTVLLSIFGEAFISNSAQNTILLGQYGFQYELNFASYSVEMGLNLLFIALLGYASWWLLEHKLEIE
jgi:hypothetical protein